MTDNFSTIDQSDNYQNQDNDEIDLRELIGTLLGNKWLIIAITTFVTLLGLAKAIIDTPIYKADVMMQVEESSQPLGNLEPMMEMLNTKLPVEAEIEIIKSRMVLGSAITSLNRQIIAQPNYFPLVGETIARRFNLRNKNKISAPLFGQAKHAWGGEQIKVDTLDLPLSWINGPALTLVTGNNGNFKVIDIDEQLITEGKVGKLVSKTILEEDSPLRLFVSLLKARPGTTFTLLKQSKPNAIDRLSQKLSVSEKGKGSGILNLTLESPSPTQAMQILNNIANIYVRLNVEQKSEESQKTLEFLDKQLPMIKNQLEAATTALNEYRLQRGSINLEIETQSILEEVVAKKTQITLLQQQRDELRRSFTSSHPSVVAIDKQISRLEAQMENNNSKITKLPETQQIILRLSRDVQVNTELYTTLLNHSQTIKVAKAGTVGDVRIIDHAIIPTIPIKPKKALIVAVAFILGLILSIATAFIRKALSHGIDDPDIIEKQLNIPIYTTVSHSALQQKISARQKNNKQFVNSPALLALEDEEDLAIESLRSLRTTLHFAFLEAKNNIIMITGPSPGIGKTFISTNLAVVLGSSGKKILLIDGDLRKGYINKTLGVGRENGLSDLISKNLSPDEAIRNIEGTTVDFIPTGEIPPNPSELLLHERFGELLEYFSPLYDHIIIDSPPVLAVTDACIIGRLTSANLLVVKAGQHTLRELQQSIKRFKQNDVVIKGVVFNDIPSSGYGYGYGYGKYIYQYNYQQS